MSGHQEHPLQERGVPSAHTARHCACRRNIPGCAPAAALLGSDISLEAPLAHRGLRAWAQSHSSSDPGGHGPVGKAGMVPVSSRPNVKPTWPAGSHISPGLLRTVFRGCQGRRCSSVLAALVSSSKGICPDSKSEAHISILKMSSGSQGLSVRFSLHP